MRDKALSFGRNKNPVLLRRVLALELWVHARLLAQFDRRRPLRG
jgi:hypothetical protein